MTAEGLSPPPSEELIELDRVINGMVEKSSLPAFNGNVSVDIIMM